MRRFVIDNALMWLRDYGFDGLRLDAVHAIFSFDAVHVLEELAAAVRKLGEQLRPHLVLIAESDLNDPRLVRPPSRAAMVWTRTGRTISITPFIVTSPARCDGYYADFDGLADVAAALRDGYVYQGQYSRASPAAAWHGRRRGVERISSIVCAQNHDQIGNRAQGERLSMLLECAATQGGRRADSALAVRAPAVPGRRVGRATPFLYFTDHENAELGRLVAEGRSKEFSAFRWQGTVPNPQELETFERSKLDWSELSEPRMRNSLSGTGSSSSSGRIDPKCRAKVKRTQRGPG